MSEVVYDGTNPDDKLCVVSAYAVRPFAGSEPGVGFAFIDELQRHLPVLLYTESQFIRETCRYAEDNRWRVKIVSISIGESARQKCWNQGDWSFYVSYWIWQMRAAIHALSINRDKVICYHHLNMIGFREPGYLWLVSLLKRRPFSIGPLGGANIVPPSYYAVYGPRFVIKQGAKNIFNLLCFLLPSVQFASILASKVYICNSFMLRVFRFGLPFANKVVLPEVFVKPTWLALRELKQKKILNKSIEIALVGKGDPRKGYLYLPMIANEVERICHEKGLHICFQYKIYGIEKLPAELLPCGRSWTITAAGNLNIENLKCSLLYADALLHLSIDEGTPNAVIEAASAGLPVIIYHGSGAVDILMDECYSFNYDKKHFISDVANEVCQCMEDMFVNGKCRVAEYDRLAAYLPEETTRKIFGGYF